jgi:hypothetical protein
MDIGIARTHVGTDCIDDCLWFLGRGGVVQIDDIGIGGEDGDIVAGYT